MLLDDLTEQEKQDMTNLLKQVGSDDKDTALAAQKSFAAALTVPLRQGILIGDIGYGIFKPEKFDPAARIEYPIDLFRPDNSSEFTAYVIPNQGKIPHRLVEGDVVTVPTYDIGAGIDFLLRYAKEARWDIVARCMEVLEAGFVQKVNNDSWHTILAAGFDRNIVVSDANAAAGQFTKRLVSLAKLVMRRNAGGNSTSMNRGRLTHIFLSPEAIEDMRNWNLDQVDEVTRREIYLADDVDGAEIFGVKLVPLDEFGEGQEYQKYYEQVIAVGASNNGMASGDVEIAVGLDLSGNSSFVMPIRDELQIFEDPTEHRSRIASFYGWQSQGMAVLDNSKILLLSM
jgi:hypothetical protein